MQKEELNPCIANKVLLKYLQVTTGQVRTETETLENDVHILKTVNSTVYTATTQKSQYDCRRFKHTCRCWRNYTRRCNATKTFVVYAGSTGSGSGYIC